MPLTDEPALADPGLATDQHDHGLAKGGDAAGVIDPGEFAVAADGDRA